MAPTPIAPRRWRWRAWGERGGVSAGIYFSLALRDDGSVMSWGSNIYGQLGHGGLGQRATPGPVTFP